MDHARHSTALSLFDAPGLYEGVEGRKRILLGLGHPDFLQAALGSVPLPPQ
jgi:hypothetical protein